jgi:hypothetical protein
VVLKPNSLRWTGQLQPSDLSRDYTVRIDYKQARYPVVRVLCPELRTSDTAFLPHVYDDGTLCLHHAGQWTGAMLIVDTIVPWAAEWLMHYEIWLATGQWFGDYDASTTL